MTLKAGASTITRRPTLLILAIVLVGLVWLRTFHPLLLPIYYDEALHIERAERTLTERTLLMGTEGGKYLEIWLIALILPFTEDPLLTARLLSAVFGLLGGIGCYLLARHLYRRVDVALIAVALYAMAPYLLFFDRLAMSDGLLSALAIWGLLLSLLAVRQGRWWQALALGLCLGLAAATKLNGFLILTFPILVAWLWRDKSPLPRVLSTLLIAWLLAIPWLLPSLLDFIPQYESTIERSWMSSTAKGIPHITRIGYNLNAIIRTLWIYLTPPILLLTLIEIGQSLRRRDKATWSLALAALIFLLFFLLAAGIDKFHPRYILPTYPFLLILAARGLVSLADWFWERIPLTNPWLRSGLLVGMVLLVSLPALRFDHQILTNPPQAPWLPRDRQVFVDGSLAGYGVIDASTYLREQADELGMIIVVRRTDNQKRTGAWGYYLDRPNILIVAINLKYADPQELIQALRDAPAPVFVALDRPSEDRYVAEFTDGPYAPYSSLIATFPRPGGASRIEVYRVRPQP
jgi:4-amino-4-deoxy-L-arabinose transferase-like glycosyltransferase